MLLLLVLKRVPRNLYTNTHTHTYTHTNEKNYAAAAKIFGKLTHQHPDKPEGFLGQAKSLDKLADKQRSNSLLSQALQAYKRYLALGDAIADLAQFRAAAERCIERMRFMGKLVWL